MDLIATDPPIVVVSRLIESFNRVSNCRRKKGETLTSYTSRFSGLASEHLMHADTSPNSKIGEVLAITLLTNANLGETTHQSAKIQLINAAKARHPEGSDASPPGPKCILVGDDCEKLRTINTTIVSTSDQIEASLQATDEENTLGNARHALEEAKSALEVVQSLQQQLLDKIVDPVPGASSLITVKARHLPLYLEDAISVIRSLEQSASAAEGLISTRDVERVIQNAFLAARRNNEKATDGKTNNSVFNRQVKAMFGQSRKSIENIPQRSNNLPVQRKTLAKRICKDCAEKGHYKGDLRCKSPSVHTLKMRERSQKFNESNIEDKDNEEQKKGTFFRRSSRANKA